MSSKYKFPFPPILPCPTTVPKFGVGGKSLIPPLFHRHSASDKQPNFIEERNCRVLLRNHLGGGGLKGSTEPKADPREGEGTEMTPLAQSPGGNGVSSSGGPGFCSPASPTWSPAKCLWLLLSFRGGETRVPPTGKNRAVLATAKMAVE